MKVISATIMEAVGKSFRDGPRHSIQTPCQQKKPTSKRAQQRFNHRTLSVLRTLCTQKTRMMIVNKLLCLILTVFTAFSTSVSASVFLPYETRAGLYGHSSMSFPTFGKLHRQQLKSDRQFAAQIRRKTDPNSNRAAMAIPGYGVAEQGG